MNRCRLCHNPVKAIYLLTAYGYECLSCSDLRKYRLKKAYDALPDEVEELPPIDGKYQKGVIALNESAAKALVDLHYNMTPSMMDLEH